MNNYFHLTEILQKIIFDLQLTLTIMSFQVPLIITFIEMYLKASFFCFYHNVHNSTA